MNAATSGTATITSIDPNNSIVFYGGMQTAEGANVSPKVALATCVLTNSTTITATRNASTGDVASAAFIVVEFMPGIIKSLQRGTIVIATSAASNTATITTVATGKTLLIMCGSNSSADNSSFAGDYVAKTVLTNATTITATRGTSPASYTVVVAYQAVELF